MFKLNPAHSKQNILWDYCAFISFRGYQFVEVENFLLIFLFRGFVNIWIYTIKRISICDSPVPMKSMKISIQNLLMNPQCSAKSVVVQLV